MANKANAPATKKRLVVELPPRYADMFDEVAAGLGGMGNTHTIKIMTALAHYLLGVAGSNGVITVIEPDGEPTMLALLDMDVMPPS